MALSWCKVASNLDSHPKIRKAGRLGREVFLFALRRNAEPNNQTPGQLAKEELDPEYVSQQLMMDVTDAVTGVTAACHSGLLRDDGDFYSIVAWKDVWGRGSGGSAERMAKHRENKKLKRCDNGGDARDVTDRHGDKSDIEERRREEKRYSQVDADLTALLVSRIVQNNPRAKQARMSNTELTKLTAKWAGHVRLMREVDGHSPDEIRDVIVWCQESEFWRGNILSTAKLRDKWDQLVLQMARNKPSTPRVIQQRPDLDDDEPPLFTFREAK